MMKRVLIFVLALLICASAAMAEGERRGGRNDGSMDLLNKGIALMNGDGVALIEWPYNWQKPEAEKNMAVLDEKDVRIVRIEKVELDPKGHHLVEGSQRLVKEF